MISQAIGGYTYHPDQTWKAELEYGSLDGPAKQITMSDNSGADLNIFLCKDPQEFGVAGIAWVGSICKTYWPGYNAGIVEKRSTVLGTSEVKKYM